MLKTVVLGCALIASFAVVGCEITTYECLDHPWDDNDWIFDDDDVDDGLDDDCLEGDECPMVCAPGSVRFCEAPTYCSAWGEQLCLPDGTGWGPCIETSPPLDCSDEYDEECCVEAGGCCEDVDDLDDDDDEQDSVGDCEEIPEPEPDPDPDPEPCPDGDCGCATDDECDAGLLCIDALCTDPEEVCIFDFECGEDATCLNNECHDLCECECPIGQSCEDGVCMDAIGTDECVFDDDCGDADAFICIDATCHAACTGDDDCLGLGEACLSGACRADTRPVRECASDDDCDPDVTCQRGLCRLPCVADINCSSPTPTCGDSGYCGHSSESDSECLRASDCSAEGASCRDGHCVTEG